MGNASAKDYYQVARERHLTFNGKHLPYNKRLIHFAKKLRNNMTDCERLLWENFLSSLPVRVYAQRPIDKYQVKYLVQHV